MGIIEQYVQSLPDGKLTKKDVPNLCGPNPQADCNHAVGHMMLLSADNDFNKARDLCSGIIDRKQRFICFHGMFMEHFVGGNLIEHGLIPKSMSNWPSRLPEDKEFCKNFNGDLQLACWREIVHPAYFYFKKDAKAIFDFCENAPTKQGVELCKEHAVPELAGGQEHNFSSTRKICALEHTTNPRFEANCDFTLVSLKMNFVNADQSKDVVDFCSSLDKSYQPACFRNIGRHISVMKLSQKQKTEFCVKASDKYKKLCLGPNQNINPLMKWLRGFFKN